MKHAQVIVPEPLRRTYQHFHFAPAVRAGSTIYVSGQVGVRPDMTVPDTLEEELEIAFRSLELVLAEAGAGLDDIVALDTFHVGDDFAADAQAFTAARLKHMSGPHPAWTAVQVASLLLPGLRVEIRATAFLGSTNG
jgi:enamine deaminase RidA (YjgF/YER057c/UK114 family)